MKTTTKKLPKNEIELTFELSPEDIKPELEAAAREMTKEKPVDGYRPGKMPYDTVKNKFGEMAIYEAALPTIVRRNYVRIVVDEKLQTFGEPTINVTQLAPGNNITFTAKVALVPDISLLADYTKIRVKQKPVGIEDKDVDTAISQLQKMQTKEVRVSRELRETDKVVVDMDMGLAGIPIDGGQAKGHSIYLNEGYFIPGLKEKILGMKEGETREFKLKFPEDHFKKDLAGKDVDVKVAAKEIYELIYPELNEEFAKSLGQDNLNKLKDMIRSNMQTEAEAKERQRAEIELLETLVEKSRFGDIPDELINQETERMMEELKQSVAAQGGNFGDYLKSIKKSEVELKLGFAAQAVKRIKTALIIRDIGKKEKVEVKDSEVMEEVQKLMNNYSDNAQAQEQIRSNEYQDYIRGTLKNKKVMEFLREKSIEA